MKLYAICPISEKGIDERVARINASFTVLLLLCFGWTQNIIFIAFLAFDFFLRGMDYAKFSPLAIVSQSILRTLNSKKVLINASPKIFAARIGIAFSVLIISAFILEVSMVANIFALVFGIFCFLEAAFGFCMACKIYPLIYNYLYSN